MWSIKQNVEVEFSSIEFKDALLMIPVMDELVDSINNKQKDIDEYEKEGNDSKQEPFYISADKKELPILIKRYNLLSSLGFVSTIDLIPTVKL